MAGSQSMRLPVPRSGQSNWWADAGNTVEDLKRRAEAKGREIYEEAIRLGRPIIAKTTADLVELGARELMMDPRVAAARAAAKPLAKVAANPKVQEAAESVHRFVKGQGSSTVNGAVDAFTMGGANHITAGVEALADSGLDFEQLGGAYRRHIAEERARDRYDELNFGTARKIGQVAGVVGQVALTGPLAEAAGLARFAAPAVRYVPLRGGGFVEATQAVGREVAAVAGAGATSAVGTQALGDAITGHRSTFEDYLAAAEAGAMEARLARKFNPVLTGALGSGVTSVAQDVMNGRRVSAEDAFASAAFGGAGGYLGNRIGELSGNASMAVKGKIGERLMKLRTLARGDGLANGPWYYRLPNGRRTVPDGYIREGLSEAKFGPAAALSLRQQEARALPDIQYRLDQFLPRDVGALVGVPAAQFTSDLAHDENQWEQRRPSIGFSRPSGR